MANQPKEEVIVAYKGFDTDLICNPDGKPFQYEIGKTYELDGKIEACRRGFHACEYPLNVFDYYAPAGNRFAIVEQSGQISREGGDTKVASSRITIKAELTLPDIIKAAIDYTFSRSKPEGDTATGDRGAASATGYQGAASATGYRGAASATGDRGAASATGDRGAASATGYQGAASATGDQGAASATGYQGAASATGYQGAASATGDRGAASATGYQGAASATGYQGAASATGDRGAASATGYQGAASATGDRGAASATGYLGAASATGYQGAASATGKHAVAAAVGIQGRAKGLEGCAIVVCYRDIESDGDDYGRIVHIRAAIVGQDGIKPDTWYSLNAEGEFIEV
ncbi:hypothetical protein CAL14_05430 [Bordetella genomosp. 9]|uniref:DUF7666 domain-containing protein n=1 Tax=Bordetella genomosp. 9 TaxID=1416803 RepID=UPI000A290539|nr:hypothetical protein [Bordetella genomosp. 9]ARP89796.1 hypothetical protein CAL14_05430 [Bordetella genomosp. 9]